MGTRIEFMDGLELRADVEVFVLESLDITEEEDISFKDQFGLTDREHFKIIGEKPPLPHALEDYLERFDSMVNDLKESPMTVVLNYHQFPPVSTSEIEAAERLLGYALPAALKVFYQQTNGLQLRWIKTDNPQYDPLRDVPEESPLSWDWSASPLKGEDGIVMLQPLERLLDDGGLAEASVMQPKQPMYQLQYLDQTLSSVEFQSKLRIFDRFSREQQAILLLSETPDPCLHIGKLGQVHYGEGYLVDVGTYLEFLIARLALVERRKMFMPAQPQNVPILYYGSRAFWNWQTMEAYSFELAEEFPLCGQRARPCEFNKDWIQRKNASLSRHWITKRQQQLQKHWEWVENGGYVYNWSRFKASGSPWLNALRGDNLKGNMAVSLGRLDGMSWRGKQYPYLGYAAMDAHGLDAAVADLKWSVFIHSNFEGANFAGANLRGVDFTGCNLQNANFQGADLAGTDFEIADLRGADFTGTNSSFARFPGAKLGGIKRNTPNPIAQPAPIRSLTATVLLLLNDLHVNYLVADMEGFPEHITLIPMRTENNLWGFADIVK
ncbi:MAG: pentapeptide repeat-containing protein, partial [Bacteroidia bacterium]